MTFFFCKQKTAYEMRISDWSSDVCSSDLPGRRSRIAAQCGNVCFLDPDAVEDGGVGAIDAGPGQCGAIDATCGCAGHGAHDDAQLPAAGQRFTLLKQVAEDRWCSAESRPTGPSLRPDSQHSEPETTSDAVNMNGRGKER